MMTARVLSLVATVAALGAGLLAGACTYTGKPADNPVERRFTYMSYLAADDLRAVCTAGTPERYRFVYNAEYSRQVRLYEVEIEPDGRGAVLEARIFGGAPFGPFEFGFDNWLTERAAERTDLTQRDVRMIDAALEEAGFQEPPRRPIELWSDRYYWLVSGCVDGAFMQNGYPHPSRRYDRQRFADVFALIDPTDVGFVDPPPYEDTRPEPQRRRPRNAQEPGEDGHFVYTVEPN